jgi:hypothetical protein
MLEAAITFSGSLLISILSERMAKWKNPQGPGDTA